MGSTALMWALLGCTPGIRSSSPETDSPTPRRSIPAEIDPLAAEAVVDHAGRWKTRVEALKPPHVQTEPGYVRVTVDLGTERSFECFVYDEPFDAGQAMTRLFRAAEVGIDYTRFEVEDIEFVGGAPVVFVTAHFVSSKKGAPRGGMMKVALSPRTNYPVFCSHEESRLVESFPRVVRGFLDAMEPRSDFSLAGLGKSDVPLVEEKWILRKDEHPVGFALWRQARLADGTTHSLHVASTFAPQGEELVTTDSVSAEAEDATGLTLGRYLDLVGTKPELELALIRRSHSGNAFSYAAKGGAQDRPIQSAFSTESPLQSTGRSFEVFRARAAETVEYLQYLPELDPVGPTRVQVSFPAAGRAQVQRGEHIQQVKLDGQGLPESVNRGATLVERRLFESSP